GESYRGLWPPLLSSSAVYSGIRSGSRRQVILFADVAAQAGSSSRRSLHCSPNHLTEDRAGSRTFTTVDSSSHLHAATALDDELNEAQRSAVFAEARAVRVVAGPGSGGQRRTGQVHPRPHLLKEGFARDWS
ncbi:unnamed protein product, partial [Pylaiella littoralis]